MARNKAGSLYESGPLALHSIRQKDYELKLAYNFYNCQ